MTADVNGAPATAGDSAHEQMKARHLLRTLPVPTRVLLLGVAINRAGSLVLIFLALYATTTLHFSAARAGLLVTFYGLGAIAGVIVGGWMCDQIGARLTIIASMAGSAVAVTMLTVFTAYSTLLTLCFCCGAANQLYRPAALVLLSQLTPPTRLVLTTAAYRLALNLGAAAAPLIGVALAGFSYRLVFLADAVTAAGFACVAWFALPRQLALRGRHEPVSQDTSTAGKPIMGSRYGLVLMAMLIITVLEAQAQTIVPLHVVSMHHPLTLYAVVIALNAALVIALELPSTPLVQRLPINIAISAGAALTGLGFALFFMPAGAWIFVVATVIWTFGEIVNAPSLNAYPALIAPEASRGRYISALNASQSIGMAIGPAIATTIYQFAETRIWLINLLLGALSGVGMYVGVVSRRGQVAALSRPADAP